MTTDDLQKFIFATIKEVQSLNKNRGGMVDAPYIEALGDVISLLERKRKDLLSAHEKLHSLGLI